MITKLKALLSSLLLLCMLLALITGAGLFFIKGGMIGPVPRFYVTGIHGWSCITMTVLVVIHFVLNGKIYAGEMRSLVNKNKK